jgi:hypothetical protein
LFQKSACSRTAEESGNLKMITLEAKHLVKQYGGQTAVKDLSEEGLSGAVYTQVSDVEEEVNGLLTFDRKLNKLKM